MFVTTGQRRKHFQTKTFHLTFTGCNDQFDIELLWDPDDEIVGFRRVNEEGLHTYTIRKQQNSASYLVAGRAFSQHYGLDTSVARRYNLQDYGEGIFGFSIHDEHNEVGRGRPLKKEDQRQMSLLAEDEPKELEKTNVPRRRGRPVRATVIPNRRGRSQSRN